ncbi:hypothetical protein BKI52_20620 [marine bacterium AO1-C]|nr:hypothetical protein BKI52_20620 [marine bacterium AO1-C]
MENNLIKTANNTFNALNDEQKKVAKIIFQSVTHRKVIYQDEVRPTSIKELAAIADVSIDMCKEVVQKFSHKQVLNSDHTLSEDSIVEPDEALQGWGPLNTWMQEELEDSQEYKKWSLSAQEHQTGKGDLLKGCDLKLAITKREEMHPNQAWASRYDSNFELTMSFVDFSKQTEEIERLNGEKLANRRRKIFQAIFALICLIMVWSMISAYIAFEAQKGTEIKAKQIIDGQKQQIDSLQKVIKTLHKNE